MSENRTVRISDTHCIFYLFQNENEGNKNEDEDREGWTSEAKKAFGDRIETKKKAPKENPNKIQLLKLHGSMSQKDRMETFRYSGCPKSELVRFLGHLDPVRFLDTQKCPKI